MTRLGRELLEVVLALGFEALRPLAAGPERRVEGEMAKKIERVGVGLPGLLGELGKVDAALLQGSDDFATLLGVCPARAEVGR